MRETRDTEITALRAELAAAKDKFTVMKGYIDSFERTLEKAGVPKSNSEGDPFLWNERVGLLAEQSIALAADNARLREALELGECYMKVFRHEIARNNATFEGSEDQPEVDGDLAKVQSALAATPAQSLAAHDAAVKVAVLREVASRISSWQVDREYHLRREATGSETMAELLAEADRIAKEAENG